MKNAAIATMRGRAVVALALIFGLSACQSMQSPFGGKKAKSLPLVQDSLGSAENVSTLVREAETAVANGTPTTAVRFAELAVGAQPQNLESRRILARAYVASGRFRSAAQAYDDLAAAGERDAATWAALATLASGQQQEALARLSMLEGRANESDLGLAFALAGETARGIEILTRASNNGGNARVRQNLALALALDGQWAAARVTAQQDLSPDEIQKRTDEWMRVQELGNSAARAAAILGVTAAQEDSGRPEALAWVSMQQMSGPWGPAPAPQNAYAQQQPGGYGAPSYGAPPNYGTPPNYGGSPNYGAPPVNGAPYGNQQQPGSAPYPQPNSGYGAPTNVQAPWGYGQAAPNTAYGAAPNNYPQGQQGNYGGSTGYTPYTPYTGAGAPSAPVIPADIPPASTAPTQANAGFSDNFRPSRSARGSWAVQLGAYSEQGQLAQQWQQIQARNKALQGREAVVSEARLGNGQKVYRLQINGFTDRAAAERLCEGLKAQGRACFVRAN